MLGHLIGVPLQFQSIQAAFRIPGPLGSTRFAADRTAQGRRLAELLGVNALFGYAVIEQPRFENRREVARSAQEISRQGRLGNVASKHRRPDSPGGPFSVGVGTAQGEDHPETGQPHAQRVELAGEDHVLRSAAAVK